MTSRRSWGRYSSTGGPAPAAAAVTELRYSQSRSITSSSLPSVEIRATKAPAGVVTLKLRLVRPPGSSLTVRGFAARLFVWSKRASSSAGNRLRR